MRTKPELPPLVLEFIAREPPTGFFAWLKYLWQENKAENALRQYLYTLACSDEDIPPYCRGDFVYGHLGGLSSVDVSDILNRIREAHQQRRDIESLVWSMYRKIARRWVTEQINQV